MIQVQVLAGFFLFVLAAVSAAGYAFVLRSSHATTGAVDPSRISRERPDLPTAQAAMADVFRVIGETMPGSPARAEAARRQLITAGYRWPSALSVFQGIKFAASLMLAVAATIVTMVFHPNLSAALLPAVCGAGFGYLLTERVLDRLAALRIGRLRRGLPSALDLMVLGIEAGQPLDAAILDTSRGLRDSHPDLAAEFTQLQLELRTNTTRNQALKNLAERSHDMELRKFANLLIDTDRFGTSLGPALKTHARYLRIRARQIAQEKARKAGVKLIFPVFFLIFPSVILVTLGPALILILAQMSTLAL